MGVRGALRSTSTTFKVFILLECLLMVLATFEIVGTINLALYGPKEHIGGAPRILVLVAVSMPGEDS